MKTTKEVKEILLTGFDKKLDSLRACEGWYRVNKNYKNEIDLDFWENKRRICRETILKGVEGLVEGEKTPLKRFEELLDKFFISECRARAWRVTKDKENEFLSLEKEKACKKIILKEIGELIEVEGE